jgi:hypothetical protein
MSAIHEEPQQHLGKTGTRSGKNRRRGPWDPVFLNAIILFPANYDRIEHRCAELARELKSKYYLT